MAYVTPPTFTASTTATAADANILGDDIVYLKAQTDLAVTSGFIVSRGGANESFANTGWHHVTFTTELLDEGGWISVTSTTATVPASAIPAGYTTVLLDIRAYVVFAAHAVGIRQVRITQNNVAQISTSYSAASADTTDPVLAWFTIASAGDTFCLDVQQTSGSALNATGALAAIVTKPIS